MNPKKKLQLKVVAYCDMNSIYGLQEGENLKLPYVEQCLN